MCNSTAIVIPSLSPFDTMLCLKSTGTCVASENEASWYVEPCECTEGWTGDLCDEDIDGCAENPCFSLCTDVVASKVVVYVWQTAKVLSLPYVIKECRHFKENH